MTDTARILLIVLIVIAIYYMFRGNAELVPNQGTLKMGDNKDLTTITNIHEGTTFTGVDESADHYANVNQLPYLTQYGGVIRDYEQERQRNLMRGDGSLDPDMYNANNYLPQEKHDDWFEVIEDPVSITNRNLISVQRPIGINTIGESLKNATWDLRPAPVNPKIVVSPWNQSTIEPDYNLKCLC